jgi:hypothetical protein
MRTATELCHINRFMRPEDEKVGRESSLDGCTCAHAHVLSLELGDAGVIRANMGRGNSVIH